MSLSDTPTPKQRARKLERLRTPSDEAESYKMDWLIYTNNGNNRSSIPIGPPVPVGIIETLQITVCKTPWLRKIAFGKATEHDLGRDAVHTLIQILFRRAKVAYRSQPTPLELIQASMQGGGELGGAALLDPESSESEQEARGFPKNDSKKRVPVNTWASVDLAEFSGGTVDICTSSNAYTVYIKLHGPSVRGLVKAVRLIGRELAYRPVQQGLADMDLHRISWSHPRFAFKVYPFNPSKPLLGCKSVPVKRRDPAGELLLGDAALLANSKALRFARKYWNSTDEKEGEYRYPLHLL